MMGMCTWNTHARTQKHIFPSLHYKAKCYKNKSILKICLVGFYPVKPEITWAELCTVCGVVSSGIQLRDFVLYQVLVRLVFSATYSIWTYQLVTLHRLKHTYSHSLSFLYSTIMLEKKRKKIFCSFNWPHARLKVTVVKIMRLWSDRSSCVSMSVSPGGCGICRCLLSSQQVHCADLLFWALSMRARWYCCAGICPCLLWLSLLWGGGGGACQTKFKQTWAGTTNFVLLFVDNKSALHFPDSCQVITSDRVPSVRSPVTPPSVCCCLGSRAWARTRSRSYASATCWWCQCTSSCTGVGAGSTRRGRRLPCCKLSTWRRFPSGGW